MAYHNSTILTKMNEKKLEIRREKEAFKKQLVPLYIELIDLEEQRERELCDYWHTEPSQMKLDKFKEQRAELQRAL